MTSITLQEASDFIWTNCALELLRNEAQKAHDSFWYTTALGLIEQKNIYFAVRTADSIMGAVTGIYWNTHPLFRYASLIGAIGLNILRRGLLHNIDTLTESLANTSSMWNFHHPLSNLTYIRQVALNMSWHCF